MGRKGGGGDGLEEEGRKKGEALGR